MKSLKIITLIGLTLPMLAHGLSMGGKLRTTDGRKELTLIAVNSAKQALLFSFDGANDSGHTGNIEAILAKTGETVENFLGEDCTIVSTTDRDASGKLMVTLEQRGDFCEGLGLGVRVDGTYLE